MIVDRVNTFNVRHNINARAIGRYMQSIIQGAPPYVDVYIAVFVKGQQRPVPVPFKLRLDNVEFKPGDKPEELLVVIKVNVSYHPLMKSAVENGLILSELTGQGTLTFKRGQLGGILTRSTSLDSVEMRALSNMIVSDTQWDLMTPQMSGPSWDSLQEATKRDEDE